MDKRGKSIILIGMPGVGKSTVGVLLAKELGMDYLDTDVAIQVREGRSDSGEFRGELACW